ncbi:uncharacterized protein LOC125195467 [Salvia hispanica]|uniref:uncharacterized protein LOC125195467 n=1 Tax=Salvia hispanica TaxID=49212 RepID=UPI0020097578|nr:uncharacterized protein LOC125195467 [Salvia hispanica]
MIALCIRHQIQEDVSFKASNIKTYIHERFNVVISYKKAWYARRKALENVFGGWEESFRQLPSYMLELQSQNPGTIVEWKHNELLSHGCKKVFSYVFWAFGAAIHAFQLAQPVLTIDATHLRGRFKGKLLVACGVDANKKCLPIAYAVVDEETGDSWTWFLKHKCKGPIVKSMVWALGATTQERKYKRRRRALHEESPDVIRQLNRAEKENWSLCYDDGLRWGVTSTYMSECYNNVLRGVREFPIRALIDLTFWRTVKWWAQKKTKIQHTEGRLTPWARDKLAENDGKGQKHHISVLDRGLGHYQIRSQAWLEDGKPKGNNVQKVQFEDSKCTCGKWQTWRVPCSYACAVARDRGIAMFELISTKYHKSTWEAQYSSPHPWDAPRHEDYWAKPRWKLDITPEQLLPRKRGRGRKKRIPNQMDVREEDEPKAPRRCRNCGQEGHDRRNCSVGRVM